MEMVREGSCCPQELCVGAGHAAGGTVAALIFSSHAELSVCACVHTCISSFVFICGHRVFSLHLHEQSYKLNSHYSSGAVLHNVKFINRVIRHLVV